MSVSLAIERATPPEGHRPRRVPRIVADGMVLVDPWWGTIQPHQLHPALPTWGELELIEHIHANGPLIDTRKPEYVRATGTIPGAIAIPWESITDHIELIASSDITALFCNGPQCAATPRAVEKLLEAGIRPERLAYYRGGIQDWIGLGLPTIPAATD